LKNGFDITFVILKIVSNGLYYTLFKTISSSIKFFNKAHDEDLREKAYPDQAQPFKRMTRSKTQDPGLGQDHPLASASEPIIPQRITRSRAHLMGADHQLVSLFVISVD